MNALADMEHLSVVTGDGAVILDDVNLRLSAGRSVGVVGESGSGKSTLAAALIDQLPATLNIVQGHIRIDGESAALLGRRALSAKLGMIFQDPRASFHPSLTLAQQMGDILREAGIPKAARHERCVQVLRELRLAAPERLLDLYPHELSGGMAQRIAIAMALLRGCPILIADEATSALDPSVEASVVELLRDLRASRGLALLVISHNIQLILDLCDDVVILYAGRVLEYGPASQVLRHPAHPYTRDLLSCCLGLREPKRTIFSFIDGEMPAPRAPRDGCLYRPRCAAAAEPCSEAPELLPTTIHKGAVRCHMAGGAVQ